MRTVLSITLALTVLAGSLAAHGGIYNAPSDAGSGTSGESGVVSPPTNPGGALSPTPGTASTGAVGSGVRGAGTRGAVRGQAGRGGRGAVTGSGDVSRSLDSWAFWWNANRDRFLRLRDRLAVRTTSTSALTLLTGKGRPNARQRTLRPDAELIASVILPTLRGLLAEDKGDILDSALLGLARSAPLDQVAGLHERAVDLLGHQELSVQSTAALSLGVLGDDGAADTLRALVADDSVGRRLVGGGRVPSLVRAHAALSLGLLGQPEALLHAARNLPDSERNVKASALVGLGLIGADHPQAGPVAASLGALLDERGIDPIHAAQIPVALARLGARERLPDLLARFGDRDTDDLVRQSIALAFGQLATLGDHEVVAALGDFADEGRDAPTRHFALIALAEMAGASDLVTFREQHMALRDRLHAELAGKGKSKQSRSWAALALALQTRPHPDLQGVAVERLLAAFEDESDPEHRGAMAIALGLLGSMSSAPTLLAELRGSRDHDLRAHLALSLGMVDCADASEDLRAACTRPDSPPELRLSAAMALGLLGDRQTVPLLVSTLTEAATLGVAAASAKALGLIGDRGAVEGVRAVALDGARPAITRGFAAVALGLLAERGDLPWNEPIKAHANYRAFVEALAEIHDIL